MTDAHRTSPISTSPVTTEPISTNPVTTEPISTNPVTTEPISTNPVGTSFASPHPVNAETASTDSPGSGPAHYMGFVGVSTASSSIMRVFPAWAEILGLPTRTLVGHDLPLDASREEYRALVREIRDDPAHRGALVTTHKMNVFAAASDLFDELDPFAESCSEISSIAKRGQTLSGRAKDPLTADLALREFVPESHFRDTGAEVLIFGAGGSGTALSWALAHREDAPARVIVTALTDDALTQLAAVHAAQGAAPELFRYVRTDSPEQAAELVRALPAGSLIVNATGLGKDQPGSPLPDTTEYPANGYVWEFNYRGSLEFLHQALAARDVYGLNVENGWRYFIHGWTQVIADVFELELTPELVDELAAAAEFARQ